MNRSKRAAQPTSGKGRSAHTTHASTRIYIGSSCHSWSSSLNSNTSQPSSSGFARTQLWLAFVCDVRLQAGDLVFGGTIDISAGSHPTLNSTDYRRSQPSCLFHCMELCMERRGRSPTVLIYTGATLLASPLYSPSFKPVYCLEPESDHVQARNGCVCIESSHSTGDTLRTPSRSQAGKECEGIADRPQLSSSDSAALRHITYRLKKKAPASADPGSTPLSERSLWLLIAEDFATCATHNNWLSVIAKTLCLLSFA